MGKMGECGRKVFSHAGSNPHPKKSLVSGSEELEKLAGAAVGRLVLLPAFPCFGCLWGLPSQGNFLHLHLNKKLKPEAVGVCGVVWRVVGGVIMLSLFCRGGKLQLSSLQCLLQLKSPEPPSPPVHEPQGPGQPLLNPFLPAWLALARTGLGNCQLLQALSFAALIHSLKSAPAVWDKAMGIPGWGWVGIRCSRVTLVLLGLKRQRDSSGSGGDSLCIYLRHFT